MSNLQIIKKTLAEDSTLSQFKMALPSHISAERFQRVALTAVQNSWGIDQCDVKSVMTSLIKCAQDGLLPDNREAALVKKGKVCAYMPMVGGVLKQMRNSGYVADINVHCVYKNDDFPQPEIINGVWNIIHRPKLFGDRGDFVLAYAVAVYKDGSIHAEVMTKEQIDERRKVSPNGGVKDKYGNPTIWEKWYEEMAKKTVLHRLSNMIPTSADVTQILDHHNEAVYEPEQEPKEERKSIIESINESIVDAEFTESEVINGKDGLSDQGQADQGELVDVPI